MKINRLLEAIRKEAMLHRNKYKELDNKKYSIGKEMSRDRDEVVMALVHREMANSLQRIIMEIGN